LQWFDHATPLRTDSSFRRGVDFLVLPEIWALSVGAQLIDVGINYAIFVQGPFLMTAGNDSSFDSALATVYNRADVVLSISSLCSDMIALGFPSVDRRRVIQQIARPSACFAPRSKQKIITFMPRKMPHHAKQLCFFLAPYLPASWSMVPIMDKTEHEVADLLAISSIFLSISELEGFSLPPVEAAVSGNAVVGYTGGGGAEYFTKPVFHDVPNGDIKCFVNTARTVIEQVDAGLLHTQAFCDGIAAVKARYSVEAERAQLTCFANAALAAVKGQSPPPPTISPPIPNTSPPRCS
jgi:glycosyltransferase involved in cell wall biosynthesis